jgi:hypothetical protein
MHRQSILDLISFMAFEMVHGMDVGFSPEYFQACDIHAFGRQMIQSGLPDENPF